MHELADGDAEQEPVCLQIDACDAYTRTSRPALIEACEEHMPSMLKYHRMAYGGADEFIMLWQGQVMDVVQNHFGVWQGAPLGMHGFCLGNIRLMRSLFDYCATHRMFDDDPDHRSGIAGMDRRPDRLHPTGGTEKPLHSQSAEE